MSNLPISYLNGYEIKDKTARENIAAQGETLNEQGASIAAHGETLNEQGASIAAQGEEIEQIKEDMNKSVYISEIGSCSLNVYNTGFITTGETIDAKYIVYSNGMKELIFRCENNKLMFVSSLNMRYGAIKADEFPFLFNTCNNCISSVSAPDSATMQSTGVNALSACKYFIRSNGAKYIEFGIYSDYSGDSRTIDCRILFN
jgi:hypothetical protein